MPDTTQFQSFDLLASLVAVVQADAKVVFSNSALEDALGISRRAIEGSSLADVFTEANALREALAGASHHAFAALRYDGFLRRNGQDLLPVHVIVTDADTQGYFVVELVPQ